MRYGRAGHRAGRGTLLAPAGGQLEAHATRHAADGPGNHGNVTAGRFRRGDVAFGPRIIVTAVAEGQRAARAIAKFLTGRDPETPQQVRVTVFNTERYRMDADYEKMARRLPPMLPLDRRIGIAEVEKVFPEPDAVERSARCLKCHISPVFDGDKCVLCGGCSEILPNLPALGGRRGLRGDENSRRRSLRGTAASPVAANRARSSRTKRAVSVAACAPSVVRPEP